MLTSLPIGMFQMLSASFVEEGRSEVAVLDSNNDNKHVPAACIASPFPVNQVLSCCTNAELKAIPSHKLTFFSFCVSSLFCALLHIHGFCTSDLFQGQHSVTSSLH